LEWMGEKAWNWPDNWAQFVSWEGHGTITPSVAEASCQDEFTIILHCLKNQRPKRSCCSGLWQRVDSSIYTNISGKNILPTSSGLNRGHQISQCAKLMWYLRFSRKWKFGLWFWLWCHIVLYIVTDVS
jgi:hypothetical protein